MTAKTISIASKGFALSLFLAAAILSAQERSFDGTWQMDSTKSHISDSRVVTLTILTVDDGIKVTMKTKKSDGQENTVEWKSKLNGQACDVTEGNHKWHLTMWYNGPTLNACKENGPIGDVTSTWKFELAPDKRVMTMTINHYEPAADPETLVFNKSS